MLHVPLSPASEALAWVWTLGRRRGGGIARPEELVTVPGQFADWIVIMPQTVMLLVSVLPLQISITASLCRPWTLP